MITIRRLRPDEWQDFRRLRLEALSHDPGAFVRSMAEELARPDGHWREMLESDDGAIFGLFAGEMLVGITAVFVDYAIPARDTAGLGMTWLHPDYRGRNVSRLIFAHRIAWAREKRLARIAVSHRADNEPSRRAILAHGFIPTVRMPHRWPDGANVDNITYELILKQD